MPEPTLSTRILDLIRSPSFLDRRPQTLDVHSALIGAEAALMLAGQDMIDAEARLKFANGVQSVFVDKRWLFERAQEVRGG